MAYDFDLFVIGGGSGGVRASRIAASLGAKVALAESGRLGGTCVNVGCVPKKLFVYGADVQRQLETAAGFGWTVQGRAFDWRTLRDNKDKEIARLNEVYRRIVTSAGAEVLRGRARLGGEGEVELVRAERPGGSGRDTWSWRPARGRVGPRSQEETSGG